MGCSATARRRERPLRRPSRVSSSHHGIDSVPSFFCVFGMRLSPLKLEITSSEVEVVTLVAAPVPTLNVHTPTTCAVVDPAPVLKFNRLMDPAVDPFAVMLLNAEPEPFAQLTKLRRV